MAGYVIKITLEGCKPPVWRNVRIPENITFKTLHEIIQVIFGWSDMHLHEFITDDKSVSVVSDQEEDEEFYTDYVYAEENTRVNELLQQHKWIRYTYDFGLEWRHKIALQKIEANYSLDYAEVIRFKGDNFVEDNCWDDEDEFIDEIEASEPQRELFELEVVNEQLRDMDYEFSNQEPQDIDGLTESELEEFLEAGQLFKKMFDELPEEDRTKVLEQMDAMSGEMERMEQIERQLSSVQSTVYQPKDKSKSVIVEIMNKFSDNWELKNLRGEVLRWEVSTECTDMESWMKQSSEKDLRNYCRYSGFAISDDMGKSEYLDRYIEGMKQNPMYILAYMFRQDIECLLRMRKGQKVEGDQVFMEACARAMLLGLVEVENCKKKEKVDVRFRWTKEGLYILDYLEQNAWSKEMERIEKYSEKVVMLINVYGIMDFDFVFHKLGEIWKSDLTKEALKRILYCQFNFNREARTYHSDFDGKNYVIGRDLDLNMVGKLIHQFASDVEYYPYTRKEIECRDSGFNMLHMCWSQMQFILENHSDLNMMEITELIDFSYREARNGKTPAEILEAVIRRTRIKSHMLQFYLWDTLMTCCMNTGLPMLKGYTRIQLAEKKKLPVMIYGLFQEIPINQVVTKATPIYKMHATFQMDIYHALEIQNVDEAVEELQFLEEAVCKGNYEIRFAQISMYFDRGCTEKLKPCLEKLKKELGNKDPYFTKFYEQINGISKSSKKVSQERSWLEQLLYGEEKNEVLTYRRSEAKIGRNDPCPCGSGKKYKKCCGK